MHFSVFQAAFHFRMNAFVWAFQTCYSDCPRARSKGSFDRVLVLPVPLPVLPVPNRHHHIDTTEDTLSSFLFETCNSSPTPPHVATAPFSFQGQRLAWSNQNVTLSLTHSSAGLTGDSSPDRLEIQTAAFSNPVPLCVQMSRSDPVWTCTTLR